MMQAVAKWQRHKGTKFARPAYQLFALSLCYSVPLLLCAIIFLSCGSLRLLRTTTRSSDSWSMFGQNSFHNSMVNLVSTRLEKLWVYDVGAGMGNFSPTIVDNVAFVGTLRGNIYLLNIKTGGKISSKTFGGAIFSGPVVDDSLMIVASSQSKENLFGYDLYKGRVTWSKSIADVESSPTLRENSLYVSTLAGDIYKINPRTGEEIFHETVPAPIRVSPAVDDSECVVGCDDGNIYAFSSTVGVRLWSCNAGSPVWCSASMNDSMILVGTNSGRLIALGKNGAIRFDFSAGGKILSMPISDGKGIYFGSDDGNFYAVSLRDGALLWKVQTGAPIIASASQTKNQIIFGAFDQNLYVVDKSDGKVVQKIDLAGRVRTAPAIEGNYLVLCAEDSNVFGFLIR